MKKIKVYALLVCLLATSAAQAQSFGSAAMRKLQMAEFAISNFYVDKVDEDKLVEEAIIKMLAQLDPHSTYSDAEEVKKMNEPLQGNFEGIGVQFQMIEDPLLVVQPVSNGPSEKVGILAGDRIIAVNDSAIAGVKMSTEDIMKRLRGPKGSKVNLTIVRRGVQDPLVFTVKRDKIPILSLDASYMIQPKIGYIRINRFGATTAEEFKKAMKDLQKQGMKDLILDLQGNGGGYLNTAIDLAKRKGQKWWLLLLLSLVSVALGVVLVLHPFDAAIGVTMLCGILLIVEGALNLGCVLYAAMELRTLDRMANAAASAAMSAIGDALDEAEAAESGIPMDGPVVYNAESKDVSEDGE